MKKTLKIALCLLLTLVLFTGCDLVKKSENKDTTKKEEKVEEKSKSKGKCDVFECIKKADTKASYEDMNKLIGFEGEELRSGDSWKTYTWELNEDESVEVTFFSTSTSIKINFDDDKIKNKKVDFSKYDEIKKAMNNREDISYATMKEKFGGVEGTLVEKSSSGLKYRWVNSEGGYLNANFDLDKTRCSMVIGRM